MVLSAFSLTAVVLLGGQKPVDPDEALRRSFERKPSFNVDAFIEQRSAGGSMKFRMWRDGYGHRRTEVVSPLAMKGRIFIDDGTTWTTYFPDQKVIRTHPSPGAGDPDDLEDRMRLIKRNYHLEIDSKVTIAGRSAIRIVARPQRATELPTQRFYLDAATFTTLKIETMDDLGNVEVQFAVRHIDFPSHLDHDTFVLPTVDGVRRETGKPPISAKTREEIERRIGFRPAMPERLPMGFRRQGNGDVLDWHGIKPVAFRLSDGLVRMVVFQFKIGNEPPRPPRPGEDPKVSKDVGDIRVEVRGDGPIAARERILASFVKLLEKGARNPAP